MYRDAYPKKNNRPKYFWCTDPNQQKQQKDAKELTQHFPPRDQCPASLQKTATLENNHHPEFYS